MRDDDGKLLLCTFSRPDATQKPAQHKLTDVEHDTCHISWHSTSTLGYFNKQNVWSMPYLKAARTYAQCSTNLAYPRWWRAQGGVQRREARRRRADAFVHQTRVKVVGTYDMYTHTHTHGHTDYICMKILSRCAAPNHALAHMLYNSYNTPHPTAALARHIYVNICAMLFARAVCDGQLPAHCERDRQLRDGEQSRCGKFTYILACAHTCDIRCENMYAHCDVLCTHCTRTRKRLLALLNADWKGFHFQWGSVILWCFFVVGWLLLVDVRLPVSDSRSSRIRARARVPEISI